MAASPLAALVGHWEVDWTYRTGPGEYAESVAEAVITRDLQGCVLTERLEGTLRGNPYSSMTLFSRKTEEQYDRITVDSEHGAFSQSEGYQRGDTLVFTWQRDLGTRVLRTRHLYYPVAGDAFQAMFYLSPSEDAPWELVKQVSYRRRLSGER